MAAGDILSIVTGTDGWWVDITISGLNTAGTYALGLGANNDPATGTPKLALTVTSLGFDDAGVATTVVRTVYGTKQVRQPYPNATLNQESFDGTNTTVRIALSDHIFAKDQAGVGNSGTNITATVLAGLYTQGSPSNAAAGVAVTNNSTLAYPAVIGNWTWPGLNKVGASFKLRAFAAHQSAQQGRPVRAITFTATDQHAHTSTVTLTAPTYDSTVGDAVPVTEYVAAMNGSAFTQGDTVTCNFKAWPWIGDTPLDSSAGTAQPTPLVGPITQIADPAGTYSQFVAVVSNAGNDGTGVVSQTLATAAASPYLTMGAAYNALRAQNNTTYTRNNCGGSTIYLRAGSYAWTGAVVTAGTVPAAWLTITTYPGDAQATVSTQSSGTTMGNAVLCQNLTFTAVNAGGVISPGYTGGSWVWLDQCTINTTSNPFIYQTRVWYLTRNTITLMPQGMRPFSAENAAPALIRGNTSANGATFGSKEGIAYTAIGNALAITTNTLTLTDTMSGMTIPVVANAIIAFNKISGTLSGNAAIMLRQTTADNGIAIVQNLLENLASVTNLLFQIAADASTADPVTNVLDWHNTCIGQRHNMGYNDGTSTLGVAGAPVRKAWSVKNSIYDCTHIKADTFGTANAARVNNWPVLYGVGASGNLFTGAAAVENSGVAPFLFEFPGLKCDQPAGSGQPPQGTLRAVTYPQFKNRKSYDGVSTGAGGGDYTLLPASPAISLQRDWIMPFDLAGNPRLSVDAAGAFAAVSSTGPLITAGFMAAL